MLSGSRSRRQRSFKRTHIHEAVKFQIRNPQKDDMKKTTATTMMVGDCSDNHKKHLNSSTLQLNIRASWPVVKHVG